MTKLTPRQLALLSRAVHPPSNISFVAKRLGFSLSTISKALSDKYDRDQTRLAAAIDEHLTDGMDALMADAANYVVRHEPATRLTERQLEALRDEVARTSQVKVAERIGISTGIISQVLAGKYNHDQTRLGTLIDAVLLGSIVQCPVFGDLSQNICLREQKIGLAASSTLRVQIYRACRSGCIHYKGKETC